MLEAALAKVSRCGERGTEGIRNAMETASGKGRGAAWIYAGGGKRDSEWPAPMIEPTVLRDGSPNAAKPFLRHMAAFNVQANVPHIALPH